MQVKSTLSAKVVLLVNIDEILPRGSVPLPDTIPIVAERYNFLVAPSLTESIEKTRKDGFKFETGKAQRADGNAALIQDFTVYNDGMVVTANNTEDAETFLGDFLVWGREFLKFRTDDALLMSRLLTSQVVAQFDSPLNHIIDGFESVSRLTANALAETYQLTQPVSVASLTLDFDHSTAPSRYSALTAFVIERRFGHSFDENIFLSTAPLRTNNHIRFLEELERVFRD